MWNSLIWWQHGRLSKDVDSLIAWYGIELFKTVWIASVFVSGHSSNVNLLNSTGVASVDRQVQGRQHSENSRLCPRSGLRAWATSPGCARAARWCNHLWTWRMQGWMVVYMRLTLHVFRISQPSSLLPTTLRLAWGNSQALQILPQGVLLFATAWLLQSRSSCTVSWLFDEIARPYLKSSGVEQRFLRLDWN
jgi:hypothetical protein